MKERRLIALIDILGFQNIVMNSEPGAVHAIYKDIESTLSTTCKFVALRSTLDNVMAKGNDYSAPITDLAVRIFSDTMVFYSTDPIEGDGLYEADGLCEALIRIYNHVLVKHGWLLRGALAIDELCVDGNIMLGRGLVRAYEAEQQQNWAAILVLDKYGIMNAERSLYTCDCDVPFKDGVREGTVLNLFALDSFPVPFDQVHTSLRRLYRGAHSASVRTKLQNTLDLFELQKKKSVSVTGLLTDMDEDTMRLMLELRYGINTEQSPPADPRGESARPSGSAEA